MAMLPGNQVVLAQAAMTKYHRLGGFKNRHLLLALKAGNLRLRSGCGEALFLACKQLPSSHGGERTEVISLMSLTRAPIPHEGTDPHPHDLI